jgi:hypothetical protein
MPVIGAELAIAFILMTVILHVSNHVRWHKFTGLCAGALVTAYITLEAPLSGMSMNPGAHACFRRTGAALDGIVDLLCSAVPADVGRCVLGCKVWNGLKVWTDGN